MPNDKELYRPFTLRSTEIIQQTALRIIHSDWDFRSERLFRIPMTGTAFDTVNAEFKHLGFGEIAIWTIFARGKNGIQNIHCDAYDKNTRVKSGLIIPVMGTIGSKMQWIDEKSIMLKQVMVRDGLSSLFTAVGRHHDITILDEIELCEPIIARLDVPHRAVASADSPRAVVSIKLRGNPDLLS